MTNELYIAIQREYASWRRMADNNPNSVIEDMAKEHMADLFCEYIAERDRRFHIKENQNYKEAING